MNHPIQKQTASHLRLVASNPNALAARKPSRHAEEDRALTRCYRSFTRQLRAACAMYVDDADVDDLVQDVWIVAAQRPAKLAEANKRTLAWLIGIAKRCAPSYASLNARMMPLDELLAMEAGDDLEGRGVHEDVDEMRASTWGEDG
jgi:DNA-directed RNA polymerase specialized sigma24 family protein